jgi:hypothetical protein
VGFERTIPEFERANIFRALESRATVISDYIYYIPQDALNCLDYKASNIGMITDYRIGKARNVFARSNTGIVDSNPTQDMDVGDYFVFVLGSGLATG